ncbi:hypothetical protein KOR34_17740 [Posidoniimonas corsicana]|uniref:Uncharacterized protein n=1 Tax=Posidoniimonas corsicana TaxID=1938618 RepID=A0A5C5VFZ8_9BACT|nr:hypothetical protein KOR34_17740 [Posidoniimonas corsicana]
MLYNSSMVCQESITDAPLAFQRSRYPNVSEQEILVFLVEGLYHQRS